MRGRRCLAALALVGATVALGAAPAGAAELEQSGWWFRGSVGVVPVQPPSVPEGGLLVAGTSSGPLAISALRYTLGDDETTAMLTLEVAEDSGGDPTEMALMNVCRTASEWEPAEGGDFEEAPEVDCSSGSVSGSRSADGATWSFRLDSLIDGNTLDVAIVPGVDPTFPEGANGSTFQIAFEAPTDESLTTTSGGSAFEGGFDLSDFEGGDGGESDGEFDPAGGDSFDDGSSGGSGGGFTPSGGGTAGGGSDFDVEPPPSAQVPAGDPAAVGGGDQTALPVTPPAEQPVAVQSAAADGNDLRLLGVLLLAACAAAAVFALREPVPALRRLGRFGERADAAVPVAVVAPDPTVGGLGRFARPRTGPVPRL
ncbi:MAG TPA: hypothetical protein VMN58_11720 [Acidimicrobiales bacterium]|nr:hypothetical protein [Acidimicrobiales bacterium]